MSSSSCRRATSRTKHRRYPVVYALHGFFIGAEQWTHEIHVPQTIEGAFAKGAQEMIVVLPDSKTIYLGSMYSSSETTGDFENFISHDLVATSTRHYRTIRRPHQPWPCRPLYGRLRRFPHRHEASRCLRRSLHHEPVLHVSYDRRRSGPADQLKDRAIANENKVASAKSPADLAAASPGFAAAPFATPPPWLPSQKPSALLRPDYQRRCSAAGNRRQIRRNAPLAFRRSVHWKPSPIPRHFE